MSNENKISQMVYLTSVASLSEKSFILYTEADWIEANKKYYNDLRSIDSVAFRENKFGKAIFIKSCNDEDFVRRTLSKEDCTVTLSGNHGRLIDVIDNPYKLSKWLFDAKSSCPKPVEISISQKQKALFDTTLCLLDKATDADLLKAIKSNKGLLSIEKMFIKSMIAFDVHQRSLQARSDILKENNENEVFTRNEPNVKALNFFQKHTKWGNLEKAPGFYYREIMKLVDNGSIVDSFKVFKRTLGTDGLNKLAESCVYNKDNLSVETHNKTIEYSVDWLNLFEKACLTRLKEHKDDKKDVIKEIMSKFVIYSQGLLKHNCKEPFDKETSQLIAFGIKEHLVEKSTVQSDFHNPFALILRLDPEHRKDFIPHMLCGVLGDDELLPRLSYAEDTIRYDLVKPNTFLAMEKELFISELKEIPLEDLIKAHQTLEKAFAVKISAHPIMKEMMLSESMNTVDVVKDEDNSSRNFKL